MTDNRIEKIRAEIERLKHQSVIDSDRQAERGLQSASMASFGKVKACEELLSFIDSMQKEPKECMYSKDNYTDEDRKVLCDGCNEDCKFKKKPTEWKPSEEQMTALRRMKAAIAGEGEIYTPLNSLYEDLKKLRGE